MRLSVLLAGALAFLSLPVPGLAAEAAVPGRFLFVVDTTFSMDRLKVQAQEAVAQMLTNGLDGWLHDGDTFGLWTFDTSVDAGYPMQVWTDAQKHALAAKASAHLKKQRCERQGRFSVLIADVQAVVRATRDVTILIVTDGEDAIRGTRHDASINVAMKRVGPEMRAARKPIVIALVAQGGDLTKWGVNSPEMLVPLPAPPTSPPPAEPVISQLQPSSPALPLAAPLQTNAPQEAVEAGPARKTDPVQPAKIAAAVPSPAASTNPTPAQPAEARELGQPKPARANVPPESTKLAAVPAQPVKAATNQHGPSVRPSESPTHEALAKSDPPPPRLATKPEPVPSAPPSNSPLPSVPTSVVLVTNQAVSGTLTSLPPTSTAAPTSATSTTSEPPVIVPLSMATIEAAPVDGSAAASSPTPAATPPSPSWLVMALSGFGCVLAALGVGVLFWRKRHRMPEHSLITRGLSLDGK
ncbi:MAG: hypothetical protein HZA90_12800 [Verrucomicrobia bacterium]|nr:hypothetical protein [Verrucomicrobiota bacterium]